MDNLLQYQSALANFGASASAVQDKASQELEEKKKNLTELTGAFEQLGIDDFSDLFKMGVKGVGKKLLGKAGLTTENAKKLKNAFDRDGTKGVVNQLSALRPQLGTKSVATIGPRAPTALRGDIDASTNLEDLLPKEFNQIKGTANNLIKGELKNLEPLDRLTFRDKFNELKSTSDFGGDMNLKQQYNLQQARRALDFAKEGGEVEPELSIASLKPQDFRELQPVIKGSIEAEKSQLHPVYRQKFDELMNERVATPADINDDLLRNKFNLHQEARSLNDLRSLQPSELEALPEVKVSSAVSRFADTASQQAKGALKSISNIRGQVEDELGQKLGTATQVFSSQASNIQRTLGTTADTALGQVGNITQLAQGGLTSKNLQKVAKNEGLQQAQNVGEDLAKKAVEKAGIKAGERAGEEATEAVASGGGPEDPIGDVIGAVVGLSTFLGGLFGARHLHKDAPTLPGNVGFQLGA
jgi:hypothetical protein